MATLRNRLAKIEDRLRACRETVGSIPPVRREHTNEEIVEITLILFTYVYGGDEEAYIQGLVKNHGFDSENATEVAATVGRLFKKRQMIAPDPTHPV